jgi:3-hydroxyisobutyrate dehydrogenase-like beta-hydroxyacid dehydrogenase
MGHGMVLNLLKGGHEVHVIAHRNRVPIEDLLSKGAREAGSLNEIAHDSDCIMLCLSSSKIVEETMAALKPSLRFGQIIIDTSTSGTRVYPAAWPRIGHSWELPMPMHQ